MKNKTKVAILYGGISAEHEVSKMSAKSVMENIDSEKFEVIPVEISKKGDFDEAKVKSADVVFPVLHGKGGEDGEIQGYLETIHKSYVGSGIEASALALDKIASKRIWQELGLPMPDFYFFSEAQWRKNSSVILHKIKPPVFIKPANTGSSIGISKVEKKKDIFRAIKEALKYHDQIIVEKAVPNPREIEVSIVGNDDDLTISEPGEVLHHDDFYTYEAKYFSDKLELIIPAKIDGKLSNQIRDLAKKAYISLGCRGLSRVDFFLDRNNKIYLSEINTMPGFTKNSMYPKLMETRGINYKDLLTRIIELALEK